MLISAYVTALAGIALGSPWLGVACGIGAAVSIQPALAGCSPRSSRSTTSSAAWRSMPLPWEARVFFICGFVDNDRVEGAPILPRVDLARRREAGTFQVSIYLVLAPPSFLFALLCH